MGVDQNHQQFNSDALRDKYRAERAKRITATGNTQYVEINESNHEQFLNDPYISAPLERAPLSDEVEFVIVGGGFGGLLAGAQLKEKGFSSSDIRLIEKGSDFGGTWYWNRYPGAACDIESYIYFPLLEELGYMPVEKYSRADEILNYSHKLAAHFGLYDNCCLQTEVTGMEWDARIARWIVRTNRNDTIKARYVMMSNGPLHRPKLPKIKGVNSYQGHTFHTSRWDYSYTGGDASGGLTKLKDKSVAIIGTGATAVQCVPYLAETAKKLYVIQRTPSSIDKRADQPTDEAWRKTLQPGWHQHRMENFNNLVSGGYEEVDLVSDGWTDIIRNLAMKFVTGEVKANSAKELQDLMEKADFEKMEQIRARVDSLVQFPEIAEKLKPWYRQFCKRPCFHDSYLQAFNKASVELIDTDGQGIEEVTANGVVCNGVEYPVDCMIYATGFVVGGDLETRVPAPPYPIVGAHQKTLAEVWGNGVRSLHGLMVRDFPNLFILGGPQGGFTVNYPHNLGEQAQHIAYIVDEVKRRQCSIVQLQQTAEDDWCQTIQEKAQLREKFLSECTPGYYNNEGIVNPKARRGVAYGGGSIEYFKILENWRATGDLAGLSLS